MLLVLIPWPCLGIFQQTHIFSKHSLLINENTVSTIHLYPQLTLSFHHLSKSLSCCSTAIFLGQQLIALLSGFFLTLIAALIHHYHEDTESFSYCHMYHQPILFSQHYFQKHCLPSSLTSCYHVYLFTSNFQRNNLLFLDINCHMYLQITSFYVPVMPHPFSSLLATLIPVLSNAMTISLPTCSLISISSLLTRLY